MNRFAIAVYADDIRQETGNKLSLMGVYQGKLYVAAIPVVLPKLCILVWARTPAEQPFKKLIVRVLNGDSVMLEQQLPSEALEVEEASKPGSAQRAHTTQIAIQIAPLRIDAPMELKVRVETEAEELKAGTLGIEAKPAEVAAAVASS